MNLKVVGTVVDWQCPQCLVTVQVIIYDDGQTVMYYNSCKHTQIKSILLELETLRRGMNHGDEQRLQGERGPRG